MPGVDDDRYTFLYTSDRCCTPVCNERTKSLTIGSSSTASPPEDPKSSQQPETNEATSISALSYNTYSCLLLVLLSVAKFVTFYVYESPGSLEDKIINVLQVDTFTYDLLFSAVSWPNIVLCWIGGVVLDKCLGLRVGLVVVASVCTVGQLLATVGVFLNNFVLLSVGRVVFGGGCSLAQVATDCIAASWFPKSKLSFVFALMYSSGQFGSVVGLTVNDPLYSSFAWIADHTTRLAAVFLVGLGTTVFMLVCSVWAAWIDYRVKTKMAKKQSKTGHQFSLKSLLDFPASLWLVEFLAMTYFAVNFPFITIAQMFYEMKYGLPTLTANIANSLVYAVAAVTSPFLGSVIDKTGGHTYWAVAGIFFGLACHALLMVTGPIIFVPFLASVLYGVSYALFNSSVWPMSAMLVDESQLGTAYGLFEGSLSLGYGSVDLVAGKIVDSAGYLFLELFFTSILLLSLLFLVLLLISDISGDKKLSAWRFGKRMTETSSNNESHQSTNVTQYRPQQSNETTRITKRNTAIRAEKTYGSFAVHSI